MSYRPGPPPPRAGSSLHLGLKCVNNLTSSLLPHYPRYLNTYSEWFVVQTGVPPFRPWATDPHPRYIYNGPARAERVHYDFLYQAFHNAALILLDQTPDTILNANPYLRWPDKVTTLFPLKTLTKTSVNPLDAKSHMLA